MGSYNRKQPNQVVSNSKQLVFVCTTCVLTESWSRIAEIDVARVDISTKNTRNINWNTNRTIEYFWTQFIFQLDWKRFENRHFWKIVAWKTYAESEAEHGIN